MGMRFALDLVTFVVLFIVYVAVLTVLTVVSGVRTFLRESCERFRYE